MERLLLFVIRLKNGLVMILCSKPWYRLRETYMTDAERVPTSEENDNKLNSDAFEYSEHLDEYARADVLIELVTAGTIEHVVD